MSRNNNIDYIKVWQSEKLVEAGVSTDTADLTILHEEPYEYSDCAFDGFHLVLQVPFKDFTPDHPEAKKHPNIQAYPGWTLYELIKLLPEHEGVLPICQVKPVRIAYILPNGETIEAVEPAKYSSLLNACVDYICECRNEKQTDEDDSGLGGQEPDYSGLLKRVLASQLPHGLFIRFEAKGGEQVRKLVGIDMHHNQYMVEPEEGVLLEPYGFSRFPCQPFLRPLITLSDDEMKLLFTAVCGSEGETDDWIKFRQNGEVEFIFNRRSCADVANFYLICDRLHIDIFDLIGKGLALPAPEGMYGTNAK